MSSFLPPWLRSSFSSSTTSTVYVPDYHWWEEWCLYVNVQNWKNDLALTERQLPPTKAMRVKLTCIWWNKKRRRLPWIAFEECNHALSWGCNSDNQLILQHNNARLYIANITEAAIQELDWELISHPPYSPDFVPTTFEESPLKDDVVLKKISNHFCWINKPPIAKFVLLHLSVVTSNSEDILVGILRKSTTFLY